MQQLQSSNFGEVCADIAPCTLHIFLHYIYICKGSGTDSFQVQNIKVSGLFQEKNNFLDLLKQKTSLSYVNILYVSEVKTSS